jgi:hypothetical protein
MQQFFSTRGVYPLKQAQAIHQHYKRLVGSYQPVMESTDSTYLVALLIVAQHQDSLKRLLEPSVLNQLLTENVPLLSHPNTKRYRLLVIYELVDQPGQYHYQDLFHLLEQLHLPFEPEKYLAAA